jgi:hypothetical protein
VDRRITKIRRAVLLACGLLLSGAAAGSVPSAPAAAAAAVRPVVAVAGFYAPGALPLSVLIDPQPYAADVLTALLVRGGGPVLTVLPRVTVLAEERTLGWHSPDVLNFSRLGALAQGVQADRLVVGWITRVAVTRLDLFVFSGDVAMNVQVFDARQGRIVWQRETEGFGLAGIPDAAVETAIAHGLARTVQAAVAAAAAP